MPLVRIEILKGYSKEYKKGILDSVHYGLREALEIEEWDRFQRLFELDEDCFEKSDAKTNQFVFIELTLFPGRSKEKKETAIRKITEKLGENPGIEPTDIFIVINEPPLDNWGIAGRQLSK